MKKKFLLILSPLLLGNMNIQSEHTKTAHQTDQSIEESYQENTTEPGALLFNSPEGWRLADPEALPPSVKLMVVGTGKSGFPPSINLAVEKFNGSIKDYLRIVKSINDTQGAEWKDLGKIKTEAGPASLSQVDSKSEWGDVKMMHVIIKKDNTIYILTAAALKEEFSKFYQDFFKSIHSLRFNKNVFDMIPKKELQNELKGEISTLKEQFNKMILASMEENSHLSRDDMTREVFESDEFQKNFWNQFTDNVSKKFQGMGPVWQRYLYNEVESTLLTDIRD